MKPYVLGFFLIFQFLNPNLLWSSSITHEWSGTIKTNSLANLSPARSPKSLEWLRLTLKHRMAITPQLSTDWTLQNENWTGSLLGPTSGLDTDQLLDLDWNVQDKERWLWRTKLYRAHVNYHASQWRLELGNRRAAWGQGRVWNPTDIVNPYNPLAPEREIRPGSLMAYGAFDWGAMGFWENIIAPARQWNFEDSLYLSRLRANFWQTDWTLLGGQSGLGGETVIGADLALSLGGGSLRSEWITHLGQAGKDAFSRANLGYDYQWGQSRPLYIFGEIYYNGAGRTDKKDYIFVPLRRREALFLAQHYAGLGGNWTFSSLWKSEILHIQNKDDLSSFTEFALTWNVKSNSEIRLAYQWTRGSSGSEFNLRQDLLLTTLQLYF